MRQKGERWLLKDGREVIVTTDLPNKYLRVLNEQGKLVVIRESLLQELLNPNDFK